jgi:predicted ArsR family transcriptional regulator
MASRTRRPPRGDRLPIQARALADPTRYAIFRYLDEAAVPASVAELTAHFGLNHNAIRQHLAKLRDAELVTEELAAPSGRGRPAVRYRPTPGAVERWEGANPYERLTTMLVELLRGEGTPAEVGRRAGRELAREQGARVDAVEVIESVARRLGFEPHREAGAHGLDVVLDRCPFASSARMAPDIICELHRGLAEGIAATAAGDVTVTGLTVKPPRRAGCRIHLQLPAS